MNCPLFPIISGAARPEPVRRPCRATMGRDLFPPMPLTSFLLPLLFFLPAVEQTAPPPTPDTAANKTPHISAAQARELFRSVDTILRFDAGDTGLPARSAVKRKLITREQVVAFLKEKMDEDKDTARIERSAIVLEKFGLLPPHFALRPFLLSLLGEQVAGFYDSKTKTVNLLDWIDADTQKPVLAHELTHALQDQYQGARGLDLDKWENAGPDNDPKNVTDDREHIRYDETDSAREAVLEGQAMVAYMDWGLAGQGRSLRTLPALSLGEMENADAQSTDSPILASAPLVLRDSLLFPYEDGLIFEQKLLQTHGTAAAFAGTLQRPPDSTWDILHPEAYARGERAPLLSMPDLHPLLDADWAPYDVGVMGALDVRMLAEALGSKGAGADAALAWDGGIYYAAQARSAKGDAARDPASVALVYLSRWKTTDAARSFAELYRASLTKRYAGLVSQEKTDTRTVDMTREGPIVVEQHNRYVFLSHTLAVPLAAQVMGRMLDAQTSPGTAPSASLSEPLRRFFASRGMLRAAMPRVY